MTMKSEFYAAYVAGLCPHQHLLAYRPEYRPDLQRENLSAPADAETGADRRRVPSRRKRALLVVLALGVAIGAWQFLSHTGQAAEFATVASLTQTSAPCA